MNKHLEFLERIGKILFLVEAKRVDDAWKAYERLSAELVQFRDLFNDPDYEGLYAQAEFAIRGDMGGRTDLDLAKQQLQEMKEKEKRRD